MAQTQSRGVRWRASVDDLYHVPEDGKAELVDGKLVLMSPSGFLHGRVSARICRSLEDYERSTGKGYAIPDNVGFVVDLPHRRSFSPDAAFYVGPPTGGKFIEGAPIFAVEVRSEEDYGPAAERRMARKRADYLAAGTKVVWDVDVLREQVIRAFTSENPETPRVYHRGETASAEPALPGWLMAVDDLFEGR